MLPLAYMEKLQKWQPNIPSNYVHIGLRIYVQCQHSEPTHEIVCLFCSKTESKALEVGVVDGRDTAKPLMFVSAGLEDFFLLFGNTSVTETFLQTEQISLIWQL